MGKLSQNNRIRIIIATSAILMWVVYSVTTLLGLDVVFNLTSPLVSGLSALLMFLSKGYMGKYWRVTEEALREFIGQDTPVVDSNRRKENQA